MIPADINTNRITKLFFNFATQTHMYVVITDAHRPKVTIPEKL